MKIRIKKVREDAAIPTYGSELAAAVDLYACIDNPVKLHPGVPEIINTGLSVELPIEYHLQIYSRSGLACNNGVQVVNAPGIIDTDYRGEIKVGLINLSNDTFSINTGDRIAQMRACITLPMDFIEVQYLRDTVRGSKGFGSTGK